MAGCDSNDTNFEDSTAFESYTLSIVIDGKTETSKTNSHWTSTYTSDGAISGDLLGDIDIIVQSVSEVIPAEALVKVERDGEVVYERSVDTSGEQDADNAPFASVVMAVVTRLGGDLGYDVSGESNPQASKIMADIWVACCVVQGIGGYCWGYEDSGGYEGFVGMDAETFGYVCG